MYTYAHAHRISGAGLTSSKDTKILLTYVLLFLHHKDIALN